MKTIYRLDISKTPYEMKEVPLNKETLMLSLWYNEDDGIMNQIHMYRQGRREFWLLTNIQTGMTTFRGTYRSLLKFIKDNGMKQGEEVAG